MPMFRPNPRQQHLTDYWNALNRNAPDDELARLAALVAPADRAAIERARALHHRRRPDPAFVARLETTLMNAYPTAARITIPIAPVHQPSPNGRYAPTTPQARSKPRPGAREAFGAHWRSALGVALVVLMVLASLAGIWLTYERNDNSHILAPPDATPTTEASPDVPMYRGNAARTGVMPGPGILGTPVELWTVELGGSINSAPAIVDDVLYLGVGDGGVYAMDTVTGETIWQFAGASPISSSPAVFDGLVYVGSDDGTLYALNTADGSEAWTFPGIRSAASVVVDAGVIYTGSDNGFLYAIDAATGEERWSSALGDAASRSPAVANGLVYMGSADGVLHAVDSATGEERWTFQTEGGGLVATTAIGHGTLIQTTFNGADSFVYALDPATGNEIWQFTLGSPDGYLPPAIGDDLVFVPSHDSNLYALDLATGEQVWAFETGAQLTAAPALVGDTLYLGGHDGFQYALDAATGAELWCYAIEGEVDFGPVVTNGVLYTGTTFGNLYAITGSGSLGAMTDPVAPASPEASPVAAEASPVTVGEPARLVWETTGGDPALSFPVTVALAPDGNLWVADGGHSQFQIIAPDGTWLESWGGAGSGKEDGEFNFIRPASNGEGFGAVAFAADGSFYVADTGNQRIQHFDANRTFLNAWGVFGTNDGEFLSPIDIAVDSQGNLWVNDDRREDVQKFDPEGSFLLKVGGAGSEPGQLDYQGLMTLAPDGSVWIADLVNLRIQQWASDGTFLQSISTSDVFGSPLEAADIAFDSQGHMLLTDLATHRIVMMHSTGQPIAEWSTETMDGQQLHTPYGITVVGQGDVYVADFDAGMLQKYQLNSSVLEPGTASPSAPAKLLWETTGDGSGLGQPTTVTIAPDGNLWVNDGLSSRYQIFTPGGTFIESWGTHGEDEGEFNFLRDTTHGDTFGAIAFAPDGTFYVADNGNHRVQHFDANRQFLHAWGEFGTHDGEFLSPIDIAVDSTGRVIVSDDRRGDAQIFAADGTFLRKLGGGVAPLFDSWLTVDQDNSIWGTDVAHGTIHQWNADGVLVQVIETSTISGSPLEVSDVGFDSAGRLVLLDLKDARILYVDRDNVTLAEWSLTSAAGSPLTGVFSITLDGEDNLYLVDYYTGLFQKYELTLPPMAPVATSAA